MRITNRNSIFLLLSISLYISGCAISNEGATDYRYFKPGSVTSEKFIKPADAKERAIEVGAPLIISLKQIYISNFVEFRSPLRWIRGEPTNGEIAVVVNAFEIGKGETTDFTADGKQNARVVFFSDDVWEGQFLSLSNLSTIYGPLKYDGGPFILDLYVVEMDAPGEQLRQLLTNLAAIGSTFYPPAAPIAGPIAQLAGTLITDDQDDRAYHHTSEFKQLGGDADLKTGILQTGNYVFIREEDRNVTTKWNDLRLDENNGRIIYKEIVEGKSHCTNSENVENTDIGMEYPSDCYYRENSYIVVEINTAKSSIVNDAKQMIYKDLSTKVFSNSAPIFMSPIPEEALLNLSQEVQKSRSADIINQQLKTLASKSSSLVENTTALDSFIILWSAQEDNKIKYQLDEVNRVRIEEDLAGIISTCETEATKVIELMNKLRNRMTFDSANNSDVINALSCIHKVDSPT